MLPQDPTVPPNDGERGPGVSGSSFTINTKECSVFHQGNVISLGINRTQNSNNHAQIVNNNTN